MFIVRVHVLHSSLWSTLPQSSVGHVKERMLFICCRFPFYERRLKVLLYTYWMPLLATAELHMLSAKTCSSVSHMYQVDVTFKWHLQNVLRKSLRTCTRRLYLTSTRITRKHINVCCISAKNKCSCTKHTLSIFTDNDSFDLIFSKINIWINRHWIR